MDARLGQPGAFDDDAETQTIAGYRNGIDYRDSLAECTHIRYTNRTKFQ